MNDGEVEDYQITIKNEITGTGGAETLTGTANADLITGGAGRDTLAGGAGADCFHYNRTSDGLDLITDFNTSEDKLDFSDMFATGGELADATITSDPITDGYVELINFTGSDNKEYTLVQIDFDPSTPSSLLSDGTENSSFDPLIHEYSKGVVLLEGVSTIDASSFIF